MTGACVLVVEGNPDAASTVSDSLAELDCKSMPATNANDALPILEEDTDRFVLEFSDVMMPA